MHEKLESMTVPLALLAAASGARSMAGVAGVARARANLESERASRGGAIPRIVHGFDRRIATAATAMAAFELMADKAPQIPDRIDPGPLLGRVVAGAIVGASVARMTGGDERTSAVAGAVIAFATAHLSFHLRRALSRHVPSFAAGVVEDVLVVGVATAGSTLLGGAPSLSLTRGGGS